MRDARSKTSGSSWCPWSSTTRSVICAPNFCFGRGWVLERAEGLAGLAHAFAVGGVGLGAVRDVRLDGLVPGALDGARGVVEEPLLLFAGQEPEQVAGLFEVVVVVGAEVEVIRGGPDRLGGIGVAGLLGP